MKVMNREITKSKIAEEIVNFIAKLIIIMYALISLRNIAQILMNIKALAASGSTLMIAVHLCLYALIVISAFFTLHKYRNMSYTILSFILIVLIF